MLTGEDFDYATLKEYADRLQLQLQRVKDVSKVELIGLQDQKIWIELSNTKAAQLGIPVTAIQQALQQQNSMASAGFFETETDRIQVRVSGQLNSVEALQQMPLLVNGTTIQLGDVAEIYRGFSDPPSRGCVLWAKTGLALPCPCVKAAIFWRWGKSGQRIPAATTDLATGHAAAKVSDQPVAVKHSVNEFMKVLAEAVIIVLLVSFFSLGFRTGLVVAFRFRWCWQ